MERWVDLENNGINERITYGLNIIINGLVSEKIKAYNFEHDDIELVSYRQHPEIDLIHELKIKRDMLLRTCEAQQIVDAARSVSKLPGDMAEVGVYKGGSAKLISRANKDKHLHLFDTFEGLPEIRLEDDVENTGFKQGMYLSGFEEVKGFFKTDPNVHIYKGLFPKSADPIKDKSFCFVNLDVDLYEGTTECLNFFYPRMVKGGIIISHDYSSSVGVKKAFDEFFSDKTEPIIRLIGSQCMIVKV